MRCRLAYVPADATASCFSKIQIGFTFLVPAHQGSPGKRAVKRVCDYFFSCIAMHSKRYGLLLHMYHGLSVCLSVVSPATTAGPIACCLECALVGRRTLVLGVGLRLFIGREPGLAHS